jgi:hypothetical protein
MQIAKVESIKLSEFEKGVQQQIEAQNKKQDEHAKFVNAEL